MINRELAYRLFGDIGLQTDWVKHFGLVGNPFNTIPLQTTDQFESLLVKTEDFINQIDPLITYFEESPPFLRIIVAPRGSGKSTILHYIESKLKAKNILVCFVTHQPAVLIGERDPAYGIGNDTIAKAAIELCEVLLDYEKGAQREYLLEVLKELELVTPLGIVDTTSVNNFSYTTNRKRLDILVDYIRTRKIRAFLAIDNYDKLDEDKAVAFLKSNLAQPLFEELQAAGISVIIVARLELHESLGKGDLSYLGKPIILNPLNPLEANSLIQKRILWKSTSNKQLFDDKAITRITIREEGIPRNILETARLCMTKAAEKKRDYITDEIVQEVLRSNEQSASEYYRLIKKETGATAGFMTLTGLAKEVDPDLFRNMMHALVDIWENRTFSAEMEENLRKHNLLYLVEKNTPIDARKNYIASEIQVLLRTIETKFPLNVFVEWLSVGEPVFTFVSTSAEQKSNSTIEEQFLLLLPAFKSEEMKLKIRNALSAYRSWTSQFEQGDYDLAQLMSDIWTSLSGLATCAYYSDRVVIEKKFDFLKVSYENLENFLANHEETRSHVADFAIVHQYYVFAERQIPLDRYVIENLYSRILALTSCLLDMSMLVLPYLRKLGIPLPTFRVKNADELNNKLAPYIRGKDRYIYQFMEHVSTSDFLIISWMSQNYVYSFFHGLRTFESDLNFDLYKERVFLPENIPRYVKSQVALRKIENLTFLKYYNTTEYCSSLIKLVKNHTTLIRIMTKKNTIDVALTNEGTPSNYVLGTLEFSESEFDSSLDVAINNPFIELKTAKRSTRLFLSYCHKDKKFAKKLALDLKSRGVKVWVDFWEINVGDSIVERINSGIEENDFVAVILSPFSVESKWVKTELAAGLMKELDEKRVVLLPILASKCKIPPLIKPKEYADFASNYKTGLEQLVNSLKSEKDNLVKRPN